LVLLDFEQREAIVLAPFLGPSFVTFSTKPIIASFGRVSFQDGRESCPWAAAVKPMSAIVSEAKRLEISFMVEVASRDDVKRRVRRT